MRRGIAIVLGVLLPLLGLSGIGGAQTAVQVQGTIAAVDCQTGALTVEAAGGTTTVLVTDSTPVSVNSAGVAFCDLQQYVGAPVAVWVGASNNELVAARIDVVGAPAGAEVQTPVPVEAVPQIEPEPVPVAGAVLGTIVVAGLIYLLVHGHDGYYRYPYYGEYYRHYYRAEYRPYAGWYPPECPIITVASPILGVVLGSVAIGGRPYLLSRDRDGRFYRYPYFGPYARYYYRPEYRAYRGAVPSNAYLRQGDPRWDRPGARDTRVGTPNWTGPARQNDINRQDNRRWTPPAQQNTQRWTPPAQQNRGGTQDPGRWTPPVPQNTQRWSPPAQQNTQRWTPPAQQNIQRWTPPAQQNRGGTQDPGRWTPPAQQNTQRWSPPQNYRRGDGPSYRRAPSQCGGGNSNQSCSNR